MQADTWSFRAFNFALAALATVVLWYLFKDEVPVISFMIPFFWIMHVRDIRSRFTDISADISTLDETIEDVISMQDHVNRHHDD